MLSVYRISITRAYDPFMMVRRDDADVTLALSKTISAEEINKYWKTCPRDCRNHEILRYAFVYHIRQLYDNASVTEGPPESKCWTFPINTPVRELRIASTVDDLTLTYQHDGKLLLAAMPVQKDLPLMQRLLFGAIRLSSTMRHTNPTEWSCRKAPRWGLTIGSNGQRLSLPIAPKPRYA